MQIPQTEMQQSGKWKTMFALFNRELVTAESHHHISCHCSYTKGEAADSSVAADEENKDAEAQ